MQVGGDQLTVSLCRGPVQGPVGPVGGCGQANCLGQRDTDTTQASGDTCASRRSRSWSSSSTGRPAATTPWGYSERTRSPARSCSRARSSAASLSPTAVGAARCETTEAVKLDPWSTRTRETLARVRGLPPRPAATRRDRSRWLGVTAELPHPSCHTPLPHTPHPCGTLRLEATQNGRGATLDRADTHDRASRPWRHRWSDHRVCRPT